MGAAQRRDCEWFHRVRRRATSASPLPNNANPKKRSGIVDDPVNGKGLVGVALGPGVVWPAVVTGPAVVEEVEVEVAPVVLVVVVDP